MAVTIQQLLRAAAALKGANAYDLSIAACIRTSRVSRILGGRTVLSIEEIQRLFQATGIDPHRLTARIDIPRGKKELASPLSAELDHLLRELLEARIPTNPGGTLGDVPLIIDRLSVTFNVTNQNAFSQQVQAIPDRSDKGQITQSRIYRFSRTAGNIRVDTQPINQNAGARSDSIRFGRIEFNPTSLYTQDWNLLGRLLCLAELRSSRITRVDVAIDYPVPTWTMIPVPVGRQKIGVFFGQDGIETTYAGSERSKRKLRIYDKARHIRERGGIPRSEPLTRVECELRATELRLDLLGSLGNPFEDVRFGSLEASGRSFKQARYIDYARRYGLPVLKAELDPQEWKDLLRTLQEQYSGEQQLPHPKDVFECQWRQQCVSLLQKLGVNNDEARS